MDDYLAAVRGKWSLIEAEHAMDLGVGRDLGINSERMEKIEC